MKTLNSLIIALILTIGFTYAQQSMYVYKAGAIVYQSTVSNVDSISFTAPPPVTVTDYDGNVYHGVIIGTHTWMLENYKCTKYNDGTAIADFEWPGGSAANIVYGGYYSWNDVTNPNFCPSGWHVATTQEWSDLRLLIGANSNPIKEAGTTHWNTANGTNETGFTALGSGHKYGVSLNTYATWWTSTSATNPANGVRWYVDDADLTQFSLTDGNTKDMIFSVRLVKN